MFLFPGLDRGFFLIPGRGNSTTGDFFFEIGDFLAKPGIFLEDRDLEGGFGEIFYILGDAEPEKKCLEAKTQKNIS